MPENGTWDLIRRLMVQHHANQDYGGIQVALISQPRKKMEVMIFMPPSFYTSGQLIEEMAGQEWRTAILCALKNSKL